MSAIFPASFKDGTSAAPIRVLMVDDSAVMRSIIERILEPFGDIELVLKTANPDEAFAFLSSQQVDVVLLDHEMPGKTGLDVLPQMIEAAGAAHIVMLSSYCQRGSKTAVTALAMGASDVIAKPSSGQPSDAFSALLTHRLRRLAVSRIPAPDRKGRIVYRAFPKGFHLECIGIGASTGGIQTLVALLSGLRGKPGVPIFLTQHLPEPFIPYLVQQVARMSDLPVSVARAGEVFAPDHIYVAPGDSSLVCIRDGKQVTAALSPRRDPVTQSRPSVNFMLSAIAECYGKGALGIILSGIGRDGTAGARKVVEAGGAVIAQDQQSSVVWGMPGSATHAGLTCANLAPDSMFDYINSKCGHIR